MALWDSNTRSRTKLKEWIRRKLGCGVINVELTDDQLDDALVEAEEYWQMWVGVVKSKDMALGSSVAIPATDIAEDVDSVVDVYFEATQETLGNYFGWAGVEFNPVQMYSGGGGGYSSLVQYFQYMEDAKRTLSSDWDWNWDRSMRVLTLSPSDMSSGTKYRVVYLSREVDYSFLATYEWSLFRDYAHAKAMRTLAAIRMKFADKPSATGGFTMDGDAMWANAEAMEIMIEEKMRNMQRPTGFFIE